MIVRNIAKIAWIVLAQGNATGETSTLTAKYHLRPISALKSSLCLDLIKLFVAIFCGLTQEDIVYW